MVDTARLEKKDTIITKKESKFLGAIKKHAPFYILLLPAILITFVFVYLPMPWILISFQDFNILKGMGGSEWVGLANFKEIIEMPALLSAVVNTLNLNVLALVIGFPLPIILALLINEMKHGIYKKSIQTISYMPHFLSWISVIAIAYNIFSLEGPINELRMKMGAEEPILYMAKQSLFIYNYLILMIWKDIGWNSIIYLAAITGVDQQLYEAAKIDGANRFKQVWHITLPCILPTAMILLILNLGSMFSSNFELVYGLQNPYIDYDVISTLIFKNGIQDTKYSLGTAISLLQGIIAFILVAASNKISKKISGVAIW